MEEKREINQEKLKINGNLGQVQCDNGDFLIQINDSNYQFPSSLLYIQKNKMKSGFQIYAPSEQVQQIHNEIFHQHQSNQSDSSCYLEKLEIPKLENKRIKKQNKSSQQNYTYKRINRTSKKGKWKRSDGILFAAFLHFHQKAIQEGRVTIKRLFEYSETTDRYVAHQRYRDFKFRNNNLTFEEKIQNIKSRYNISKVQFETEVQKLKQYQERQKNSLRISSNNQSKLKQIRQFSIFDDYNPQHIWLPSEKQEDKTYVVKAQLQIISNQLMPQSFLNTNDQIKSKAKQHYHANMFLKLKFTQKQIESILQNYRPDQMPSIDIKRYLLKIALKENQIFEHITRKLPLKQSVFTEKDFSQRHHQHTKQYNSGSKKKTKTVINSNFDWKREEKIKFIGFIKYFEQVLDQENQEKIQTLKVIRLITDYIMTKNEEQCVRAYEYYYKKQFKTLKEFSQLYMKANEIYEQDLTNQPKNVEKYLEKYQNKLFIMGDRISFEINSKDPKVVLQRIRSNMKRASVQLIRN